MKPPRAAFGVELALLLATLTAALPATAREGYPSKPITLVTHSSPGAGGDLFLRHLAKYLEGIVTVPLVVENRAGGASATAVSYVATSPPDGYLLYGATPTTLQTPMLTKTRHNYHDLQPVANVFLDPMILYVKSDCPWKSLPNVIQEARRRPGELLFGAAIPGSVEHMIIHQIRAVARVDVQPVTFEGGGELLLSVLGGHVDLGIGELQEVASQIDAGQVRALCSFTQERIPRTSLPTAREQGVDIVVEKFRGILGPKGLAPEVIAYWEEALRKVLKQPAYKAFYESNDLIPAFKNHVEFQQYLDEKDRFLRRYMKEIGLIK